LPVPVAKRCTRRSAIRRHWLEYAAYMAWMRWHLARSLSVSELWWKRVRSPLATLPAVIWERVTHWLSFREVVHLGTALGAGERVLSTRLLRPFQNTMDLADLTSELVFEQTDRNSRVTLQVQEFYGQEVKTRVVVPIRCGQVPWLEGQYRLVCVGTWQFHWPVAKSQRKKVLEDLAKWKLGWTLVQGWSRWTERPWQLHRQGEEIVMSSLIGPCRPVLG
jgi:hypothetical protein